jgi:hypothetical protein
MRIHLASLLAGGLLVAGGFALAQAPSWLRGAEAGITYQGSNLIVTSEDGNPGRLFHWTFNGQQQLVSVVAHNANPDGVVVSQELKLLNLPRVR